MSKTKGAKPYFCLSLFISSNVFFSSEFEINDMTASDGFEVLFAVAGSFSDVELAVLGWFVFVSPDELFILFRSLAEIVVISLAAGLGLFADICALAVEKQATRLTKIAVSIKQFEFLLEDTILLNIYLPHFGIPTILVRLYLTKTLGFANLHRYRSAFIGEITLLYTSVELLEIRTTI